MWDARYTTCLRATRASFAIVPRTSYIGAAKRPVLGVIGFFKGTELSIELQFLQKLLRVLKLEKGFEVRVFQQVHKAPFLHQRAESLVMK